MSVKISRFEWDEYNTDHLRRDTQSLIWIFLKKS